MSHARHFAINHRAIVLAGLAGSLAEVVWIALYCAATPLSGSVVLRQITVSFAPGMAGSAWAPTLGLLIHFALGVAVAYAFSAVLWQAYAGRLGKRALRGMALLALAAVWFVNFFVVLPVVNADFIALMPDPVTFASKLLFGVAMAATLNAFAAPPARHAAGKLAHV